jgi:outer membrane protein OmpA-like peptidoglycan-associated protein/cell division protein FtsN
MKLNKIFTLSFCLIVIIFNYGYSYNSFDKERINLNIQSERYHVIVASFKSESLAQKELVRLNNSGYELAEILYDENGKNFRISIMSFDKRSSAINYTKEINQSGFNDTWIFYNSLNQSSPNPIVKSGVNSSVNLQSNSTSKNTLPVSLSQDEGDPEYHILVGSFNNENYANNFKESLLMQGFLKAKVIKEGAEETYNVVLNTFRSKVDADKFIQTLLDTPYRNATIQVYPSKKLSKVTLPRPIPNQSIPSTLVSPVKPVAKLSNLKKVPSKAQIKSNSTPKDIFPISQSQDEGDPEYHILVGSFNNENYANNFKESLLRQGYLMAKVIKEGDEESYNVVLNTFTSKVDADKFIQTLSDTPYRNATIPVYPSKKLSKVTLPRPIPNQSISEQIALKGPINRNYVKQIKEQQTQIIDKIEEGKTNDVDSEKPPTDPITEPIILNKPVNTSSVEQYKEEQANIIDEIADEGVNNVAFEKSIVEPKMQIPGLDQEQDNILLEVNDIPTPQKKRKIDKRSEKNIFLAKKDYDKYSYDKAQQKYLEIINTGKDSKEAYEYLANSYFKNSQYEKAVIWYNKLISRYPNEINAEIYYRASLCFKSQGAYEISNTLLEKYLEKSNNLVIRDYYEKNPNYLETIKLESKKFGIELTQISTENSDFGPSFYGDNQLIYSSTLDATGNSDYEWSGEPFLDLFIADIDSLGNLSNTKRLSNEVNTEFHESSASVTRDKKKMYFTRNNFINGKIGTDRNKQINLKIYTAESDDGENWGNIKELPFNDDNYSVAHPTLSVDEKKLYFSSDMPGTFGYSDIWYVDIFEDGSFGQPINLGPQVNTEFRESFPFIGENNTLYFSSDGRIGLGGFDIYYTGLDKKGFPVRSSNIGEPVNSKLDDFGFIYKKSKDLGYFSSNRKGLWGSKSDEVYKVSRRGCDINLSGIIFDQNTKKPIPNAYVRLINENGQIISDQFVGEDAVYSFDENIQCALKYTIEASKNPGYSQTVAEIQLPDTSGEVKKDLSLDWSSTCIPDDLVCLLDINPILFDLDKYYINPKAAKELRKVYAAMIRYPDLEIFIASHTDSRGSNDYNQKLSINRATSTKNWLVRRGIASERLTTDGFGEFELENYCEDNITCQEEEHQLNRRSVFKIK